MSLMLGLFVLWVEIIRRWSSALMMRGLRFNSVYSSVGGGKCVYPSDPDIEG